MSKIALDLKEFKHVKSDDKSTTLQHKEGHVLTLDHKHLSPESKAQLDHLAKCSGGKVKMADGGDLEAPNTSMNVPQQAREYQQKKMEEDKEWKKPTESDTIKRGEVKHYAEGDMVNTDPAPMMSVDPNAVAPAPEVPQAPKMDDALADKRQMYNSFMADQSTGGRFRASNQDPAPKMFGPNGEAPAAFDAKAWDYISNQFERAQQEKLAQSTAAANTAVDENASRQAAGLPPIPVPTVPGSVPQAAPTPQQPMATPQPQQPPGPPDATADYAGMLKGGYNKEMQGINETAKAQGALGQAEAGLYNAKVQHDQEASDAFKQQYQSLDKERNDIISDIKEGYVSPDKYWTGDKDGNGSHSKIMAGIGMIIAGFNPTNNPNAAVNFLKFQMDQNLNAQVRNLGAKETLLSHNLRQFGNLRDAADMTRVMQNDMLIHQLGSAAANAQTPLAKAAALQAQGKLMKETAPMFMQLNMNQAMIKMAQQANGQPNQPGKNPTGAVEAMLPMMRQFAPERAKEWETRLVPGVGVAAVPLSEDDKREFIGKTEFDKMAKNYMDFASKHSGTLTKRDVVAQGATMALNLQNAYRNATKGGVYKEGEQKMIEKIIPSDPTQFFASLRTNPKLKQLIQDNQIGLNTLKSQKGMAVQPEAPAVHPNEGRTGTLPDGTKVKVINGKVTPIK